MGLTRLHRCRVVIPSRHSLLAGGFVWAHSAAISSADQRENPLINLESSKLSTISDWLFCAAVLLIFASRPWRALKRVKVPVNVSALQA